MPFLPRNGASAELYRAIVNAAHAVGQRLQAALTTATCLADVQAALQHAEVRLATEYTRLVDSDVATLTTQALMHVASKALTALAAPETADVFTRALDGARAYPALHNIVTVSGFSLLYAAVSRDAVNAVHTLLHRMNHGASVCSQCAGWSISLGAMRTLHSLLRGPRATNAQGRPLLDPHTIATMLLPLAMQGRHVFCARIILDIVAMEPDVRAFLAPPSHTLAHATILGLHNGHDAVLADVFCLLRKYKLTLRPKTVVHAHDICASRGLIHTLRALRVSYPAIVASCEQRAQSEALLRHAATFLTMTPTAWAARVAAAQASCAASTTPVAPDGIALQMPKRGTPHNTDDSDVDTMDTDEDVPTWEPAWTTQILGASAPQTVSPATASLASDDAAAPPQLPKHIAPLAHPDALPSRPKRPRGTKRGRSPAAPRRRVCEFTWEQASSTSSASQPSPQPSPGPSPRPARRSARATKPSSSTRRSARLASRSRPNYAEL